MAAAAAAAANEQPMLSSIEEATLDLRNVIYLALSINDESSSTLIDRPHCIGESSITATAAAAASASAAAVPNNDARATAGVAASAAAGTIQGNNINGGYSEGSTYTSSLSGSLPSDSLVLAMNSSTSQPRRNRKLEKHYFVAAQQQLHLEEEEEEHDEIAGMVGGGNESGADEDNHHNHREWQTKRLQLATLVENAVSNYEVAVFNYHNDHHHHHSQITLKDPLCSWGEDIVHLLVALLTSVPRQLMLSHPLHSSYDDNDGNDDEEDYLSSLEQLCFNSACIASDILRKYYLRFGTLADNHTPVVEEEHIHDLLEEVIQMSCSSDANYSSSNNNSNKLDPILGLLNYILEERQIDRLINERELHEDGNEVEVDRDYAYNYRSPLSCLSSKETLRLIHVLTYRFLSDIHDVDDNDNSVLLLASTAQTGYFIGHLLEYFTNIAREEVEYSDGDTIGLFDAWADSLDEFMTPRLRPDETREVYELILRYHVTSIQYSLQLMERAKLDIGQILAQSETNNGIIVVDGAVENIVLAMQDTLRHLTMIVHTTEAMQLLNFEPDPEIHVIFHPLVSSYARFTVTCWNSALRFFQSAWDGGRNTTNIHREIENLTIQVDNILIRLCRSTFDNGTILPCLPSSGEEDEIIATSLLRTMNYSQSIMAGKARFLLDVANDRAQFTNVVEDNRTRRTVGGGDPMSKRRRYDYYNPRLRRNVPYALQQQHEDDGARFPSSDERRGEMTNLILACLALSQTSSQGDYDVCCDSSSMKQVQCITSALMVSPEGKEDNDTSAALLDPLNPWHTIQVKALQTHMTHLNIEERNTNGSLFNYLSAFGAKC